MGGDDIVFVEVGKGQFVFFKLGQIDKNILVVELDNDFVGVVVIDFFEFVNVVQERMLEKNVVMI